jgi:hypothetical protein
MLVNPPAAVTPDFSLADLSGLMRSALDLADRLRVVLGRRLVSREADLLRWLPAALELPAIRQECAGLTAEASRDHFALLGRFTDLLENVHQGKVVDLTARGHFAHTHARSDTLTTETKLKRSQRGADGIHVDEPGAQIGTEAVPLPVGPTAARPGTEAKILVLEERARLGQEMHHPGDAGFVDLTELDCWWR